MEASDSSGRWVELSLLASGEAIDAIAEVFRSGGVQGVAIEPPVEPGHDEGTLSGVGPSRVLAYLPVDGETSEREEQLERALWHLTAFDLAPISGLARRVVDQEDWANAWKEHFHPVRIGQRIVVKPSWRPFEGGPDDVILELDPGMAFGTGLHPSTRMMLESTETAVKDGMRVLDIGTGSGILAVAAAELGAGEILAVDTDPVSCRVAAENSRLNGVDQIVTVLPGSAEQADGTYDVILANIIASVIADLTPKLLPHMGAHSILITSGIIQERGHLVEQSFAESGLRVVERQISGDWLCFSACRS